MSEHTLPVETDQLKKRCDYLYTALFIIRQKLEEGTDDAEVLRYVTKALNGTPKS
jgi:hypothetical protein